MIIQCPKCETQYRFDESLIEGEGVWVRCTRCQHVFFQPRPTGAGAELSEEIPSIRISDAKRPSEDRLPPREQPSAQPQADTEIFSTRPDTGAESVAGEPVMDFEREPAEAFEKQESQSREEEEKPSETKRKHRGWAKWILEAVAVLVFAVSVAGGVFLYIEPDVRSGVWEFVSPYLKEVPFLEKVIPASATQQPQQVQEKSPVKEELVIKEMTVRTAPNIIVGNLQVIKGTVVNQTPATVARIKMRLVVADINGAVLTEKYAYCGNILSDEELGTLTETEIERELSNPEGSDFSNAALAPNASIPFMLLYKQDKQEVVKTSVTVAGYERPVP